MLEVLFLFPLCAGLLTLLLPSRTVRRGLLLLVAVTHLALSLLTLLAVGRGQTPSAFFGLLEPDAVGVLFLALASTLFCAASARAFRTVTPSPTPRNAASRPASASFWRP